MTRAAATIGIGLMLTMGAAMVLMGSSRDDAAHSAGRADAEIRLPPPRTSKMSLDEALRRRRSRREFAAKPIPAEMMSTLLWAAQGITDPRAGFRTAPSAGAIYPLTVFLVEPTGVYEYEPRQNRLRRVLDGDRRLALQAAALGQPCVGAAPACLAITADVARIAEKYGDRAERFCLLEAGHVAQNVLLQAAALEMAGVPVGAFDDAQVSAVLQFPDRLRPFYLLPVGFPPDD